MAIFFERSQERAVPCPSNGCPHPYYDTQAAAQISVGGSGQLDVDSRGRFFLDAGAGEYATFLGMTQFRLGISGGAGITIPIGPRLLSVVQADWHTLLGQTSGPRNFFPITVGLRF